MREKVKRYMVVLLITIATVILSPLLLLIIYLDFVTEGGYSNAVDSTLRKDMEETP